MSGTKITAWSIISTIAPIVIEAFVGKMVGEAAAGVSKAATDVVGGISQSESHGSRGSCGYNEKIEEENKRIAEESRRKIEEEKRRIKEEKRKIEEEKKKIEEEKKREEEKRIEEENLRKAVEQHKNKIEERRKKKADELKKREENIKKYEIFIERINKALSRLEHIKMPDSILAKFNKLAEKADSIKNWDYLENFYSIEVVPFVKECESCKEKFEEYNKSIYIYNQLCEDLQTEAKNIPFSDNAAEVIRKETEVLKLELQKKAEEYYINKTINETISEMGYELIGEKEKTKKNGKKLHSNLYQFGNGTALNVTFSGNGQVAMELGALDDKERNPTEAEAESLETDMKYFCSEYEKLQKKLAEKGLAFNNLSILPPSHEYAQILNINDYDMKRDVEFYTSVREETAANREKAEYMYNEG